MTNGHVNLFTLCRRCAKSLSHNEFFDKSFLPAISKLVESDLSYDEVKRLVKIPSLWGAKITGEQFVERMASARK